MNEQNRERVHRMTRRHASRLAQGASDAESDVAFLGEFLRIRDEVLRPAMDELATQLREGGYESSVASGGSETSPAVEFHVVIPGRDDSKDTIRFFAHKDVQRGWQVIAEIELKRSPMELVRFDVGDPITRDVAEQLIVDATEQLFASALAAPRSAPAASAGAALPPGARPEAAMRDTLESASAPPVGARACVLERLSRGRVLHGLDLVGADLSGVDFTGGVMLALDLRRANLRGAVLAHAELTAARLEGADLSGANLTGANLSRANLTGAVLHSARLDGTLLVRTVGLPLAPPQDVPAPEPEPRVDEVRAGAAHVETPTPDEPPLRPLSDDPEKRWASWAGAQSMGETEDVDVRLFQGARLPFMEGPPAPTFFAAADAARTQPGYRPTGNETMVLSAIHVPNGPLSVAQYAAFCAELAVFPGETEQIHRRYGIADADARVAVDAGFAQRFREDPTLDRQWRALVSHYRDWYRREGRS